MASFVIEGACAKRRRLLPASDSRSSFSSSSSIFDWGELSEVRRLRSCANKPSIADSLRSEVGPSSSDWVGSPASDSDPIRRSVAIRVSVGDS